MDVPEMGRGMRLSYPRQMRRGQTEWLELSLLPAGSGDQSAPLVTASTILARLDLPGVVGESDEKGQVVSPTGVARFRWKIQPQLDGVFAGKMWVYWGQDRQLLFALPIQIELSGSPMRSVWLARVCSIILMLVTLIGGFVRNQQSRIEREKIKL